MGVTVLESGRDPGTFWAKWIDGVVERAPATEAEGAKGRG
jgi:hypothetical protein